jgi:hypothetical protein
MYGSFNQSFKHIKTFQPQMHTFMNTKEINVETTFNKKIIIRFVS